MNPVGADSAPSTHDRETPLGRDGSGALALVAPAAAGLASQLLKRFDPPTSTPAGRVRLAQRLWRLTRAALPSLPGLSIAQTRPGAPPACWVAAPERATLGLEPRLSPPVARGLLAGLLDTLARAHQGRVTGLRFRPEWLVWRADLEVLRWIAPDLTPDEDPTGAGGAGARQAEDLVALSAAFRGWLAEPPLGALADALALLEAPELDAAAAVRLALGALGHTAPVQRLPAPALRLGREPELAELGDALAIARADFRLVPVRLDGPEGSFQAELFDALPAALGLPGLVVLSGRCRGQDAVGAALASIATQLRARRGELVAPVQALLAPVGSAPAGGLPALAPAAARVRLFKGLVEELRRVRGSGPVVLALTDFDDADELTAAFVDYLCTHDAGMPGLLIMAGYIPFDDPRAEIVLRTKALDPEECAQLARAYLGGSGDVGPVTLLWEAARGERPRVHRWAQRRLIGAPAHMPEAVRELLRAFATMGGAGTLGPLHGLMEMPDASFFELLERALDGGWLLERGEQLAFVVADDARAIAAEMGPGDMLRWHRRLAAVAALPPGERVRHALASGPGELAAELALAAVRQLLGLGAAGAAAALAGAALAVAGAEEPSRAALVRVLAYLALDRGDPAQAEQLLAAAASRPTYLDAWLLGLARAAQDDAVGAEDLLAGAAAGAADPADRARILAALAGLAGQAGDWARARALATTAVETRAESADPLLRGVVDAEVRLVLARCLAADINADRDNAATALSEARHAGEAVGHAAVAYEAALCLAGLARSRERLGEAREALQRARGWAEALGRTEAVIDADVALAVTLGEMGLAEAALARLPVDASPSPRGANRPSVVVWGHAVRALASLQLGYVNDPLRLLDAALAVAREAGDDELTVAMHPPLVRALLFLGKFTRAAEVAGEGIVLAERLEDPTLISVMTLASAEALWRIGERDRSEWLFTDTFNVADAANRPATRAQALLGLARASAFRGGYADANGQLTEAWELADRAGLALVQAEIALLRGEILQAAGDLPAAAEAFALALARGDALSSPHHRGLALAGLGTTTEDRGAAGAYRAQAVAHLNVFIEQLSDGGRRDFMAWDERARAMQPEPDPVGPAATPAASAPPGPARGPAPPLPRRAGHQAADDVLDLVAAGATPDALIGRLNEAFRGLARAGRSMAFIVNELGEPRLRDRRADPEAVTVLGPDGPCSGVVDQVLKTGKTIWVPDASSDPAWREAPEVRDHGLKGLLGVPIKTTGADGVERVLGVLYGDRLVPWQGLDEQDLAGIEHMARHAAVALRNAVLEDESRRKTERLELLGDMTRALAGTLDVDRLLKLALGQVLAVTRCEQGYIFFGTEMACRASMDRDGKPVAEIQVSRSVIARVQADRQPLTILDVGQDEELHQKASLMIRNVRSVMCVPLVLDENLIGLIYVSSSTANRTFGRHDLDVFAAIGGQVALMLQNAQAYETIKDLNLGLEAKVRARTRELEAALRELTETQAQLLESEKLATVGTLAAGVAHEINNPLGAVLTNAQLLRMELVDPEQLDGLALIEEGARRCMEIVQALLKFSKPPQASYQTIDMRAILEDTLAMVERQGALKGIQLVTDLADPPGVLGDAVELRQVVVQVLQNAADAIHEKGQVGTVRVTLKRELAGLELAIADDGVGMPAEVQKRIFDPFYTTKDVGAGTGLGLSVCRRVIEKHGGKIQASSQSGVGTTITILLPVP